MNRRIWIPFALFSLAVSPLSAAEPEPAFRVTFDESALATPFTGRVHVVLWRSEPKPIGRSLNWFDPEPAFAVDIKEWAPGAPLTVGPKALSHPTALGSVKPGKYYVQAILDRDLGGISFAASPGNGYSKPLALDFDPKTTGTVALKIDQVYAEPPLKDTDSVKFVDIESPLLTKFHGRPVRLRAGVILPPSFAKSPGKKYPVVYEITGFGGSHLSAQPISARKPWDVAGVEVVWVVLDGNCRLGHHVFADSANNGPRGQSLVEELIPHVEKTFRGVGTPTARLVTGHSSGGWSSLWLQVAYPDVFGGCWSTSPDPVDFRDFQRVNIYAPGENLFTDRDDRRRPLSRAVGGKTLDFKRFSDMEVVMGRGGQLASFEAVFSPRGADGKPLPLWDRTTGDIDPKVAKTWEKYDIRLKLEREWKTLGPKLAGKVHVYMGDLDTFYLDGAARLLQQSFERLSGDAVVEMFPNKTHSLVDAKLRERISREMAETLRRE
ncbi:alpha/beta hydrolase-fold protein [Fimbriiglobus ruber]|uniref:Esterase n=1 Tax=Fimbriiglobus ruber TaxID=1908690 RepID=A0A225CYY0_9BACT|nr:alpha/beta hydrolase-fold protein [Fimbriiglobus ruber]OWK34590.1 hypothetical protein FRUB_10561 [Fimbriiglobus ruber]